MKVTELHDAYVLTLLEDAEHSQDWKRENWIHALSLLQTQNGVLWRTNMDDYLHSCSTRARSWCFIQSNLSFLERVGKTTFHTGSVSNLKSIPENGLWAGGLCLRNTRQACLFSHPNPQESSCRQLTIDWTGPYHEPRMVLHEQKRSSRSCLYLLLQLAMRSRCEFSKVLFTLKATIVISHIIYFSSENKDFASHQSRNVEIASNTFVCHIMSRRLMLNETATWKDMKFQQSRIVCTAEDAFDARVQATHFAAVLVCCRASPTRSTIRQSIALAVDASCTSLTFLIERWQVPTRPTPLKICWIATTQQSQRSIYIPRTSTIAEPSWCASSMTCIISGACTNNDTRRPTWTIFKE